MDDRQQALFVPQDSKQLGYDGSLFA